MRFVSVCVLHDPPETSLVPFAEFADLHPYRIRRQADSAGKDMFIKAPPIKALADPGAEGSLVMSQVNLILEEINKRHLQPLGLNIHDMWQDALQNSFDTMVEIYRKEELLQRRLYIEVNAHTTDEDVKAARRMIRSKQEQERWRVPLVASDTEAQQIARDKQERLQPRTKPTRDPLIALQCAVLYDCHNSKDSADGRQRTWTYQKLAKQFSLRSARAAKGYVQAGREIRKDCISEN